MFVAMNRFRIARGAEEAFETLWKTRDSQLDGVPGFREFHLLRGPSDEEATLYASHTIWESRSAFEAWTESESFRKAHQQARAPAGTTCTPGGSHVAARASIASPAGPSGAMRSMWPSRPGSPSTSWAVAMSVTSVA